MREILFRGKPLGKIDEDFVYGSLGVISTDLVAIYQCEEYYEDIKTLIDIGTVGQYTGLTDKNGKKIFEGDIVTGLFRFGMSIKAVVTFKDGSFGLTWYRGEISTFNAFPCICNVEYEVIGNIHDNPELLGGAE